MAPERPLTKEEWEILYDAALDTAARFTHLVWLAYNQKSSGVKFLGKKADRIYGVLQKLESEYYEAHPDEDPDRKDK